MSGDDLQAIMTEVSDGLIDNQNNCTLDVLDLVEADVIPLFGLGKQEMMSRMQSMNALDLQKVGAALVAFVHHERVLLTPDPTTKITMTSKIVNGIAKFKARTWIVALVAKLF